MSLSNRSEITYELLDQRNVEIENRIWKVRSQMLNLFQSVVPLALKGNDGGFTKTSIQSRLPAILKQIVIDNPNLEDVDKRFVQNLALDIEQNQFIRIDMVNIH